MIVSLDATLVPAVVRVFYILFNSHKGDI